MGIGGYIIGIVNVGFLYLFSFYGGGVVLCLMGIDGYFNGIVNNSYLLFIQFDSLSFYKY